MNFIVVNQEEKTLADCKPGDVFSLLKNRDEHLFLLLCTNGVATQFEHKYNYVSLESFQHFFTDEKLPVCIKGKLIRDTGSDQ
jgi:hypothetical protein